MLADLGEWLIGIHRDGHVDWSSLSSADGRGMFGGEVDVADEFAVISSSGRPVELRWSLTINTNKHLVSQISADCRKKMIVAYLQRLLLHDDINDG